MMGRASLPLTEPGYAAVREARRWLGTPYEHQASCRGAGADCLGLIRGVWRALVGPEPVTVPAYTPDWGETDGSEYLLDAGALYFTPHPVDARQCGDVLLFRMRQRSVAKHLGILARAPEGHATLVHAYSGRGVVETPLTPAWTRRIAAVFRFPQKV